MNISILEFLNLSLELFIREVLRSRPMARYNRYLRRTFYYIDEVNANGRTVRVKSKLKVVLYAK